MVAKRSNNFRSQFMFVNPSDKYVFVELPATSTLQDKDESKRSMSM